MEGERKGGMNADAHKLNFGLRMADGDERHQLVLNDAKLRGVALVAVQVTRRNDDAGPQGDRSRGSDQVARPGTAQVSGKSDGGIDPKGKRLGRRQLDLRLIALRPKNAYLFQIHPVGTDDSHGLIRGKLPSVRKLGTLGQFFGTKERFPVLNGQMNVPVLDVNGDGHFHTVFFRERRFAWPNV